MHESFFFFPCMCVYTPCSPGLVHRFLGEYLASIGYSQKKASRKFMNGNNNNNRYQNNILQHVAGLRLKINSYLSIVRYYVFKFLLSF